MRTVINPAREAWPELLRRPTMDLQEAEERVKPIMQAVREKGDEVLIEFTERFDGVRLDALQVSADEIKIAIESVSDKLKEAIQQARKNIEMFHRSQVLDETPVETMPGVTCFRRAVPIQKVGLYIPGGTAPLFSTVLMLGVPAKLAGCEELVLCTPPNNEGKVDPAILYAADLVGITKIFKVGGAQAIAALTFGTETIPQVYKIFGPGNQFVTAAKQLATKFGIAIDMPAGPSEVMVCADESAVPAFVAADLLSQAEHGADSQVILVCESEVLADSIKFEIGRQLNDLPRSEIAEQSLENSLVLVTPEQDLIDLINAYAPEHLILALKDARERIESIVNAGSVFIGNYTPESAGDYASGTNHTLPTNGFAKAFSGVSLDSFVKKITYQEITEEGLKVLGPVVEAMAAAEQLQAHKNAISVRLKYLNNV